LPRQEDEVNGQGRHHDDQQIVEQGQGAFLDEEETSLVPAHEPQQEPQEAGCRHGPQKDGHRFQPPQGDEIHLGRQLQAFCGKPQPHEHDTDENRTVDDFQDVVVQGEVGPGDPAADEAHQHQVENLGQKIKDDDDHQRLEQGVGRDVCNDGQELVFGKRHKFPLWRSGQIFMDPLFLVVHL
jgi:hypothetical protein